MTEIGTHSYKTSTMQRISGRLASRMLHTGRAAAEQCILNISKVRSSRQFLVRPASTVALTKDHYRVERGPYAQLNKDDIAYFERLGVSTVQNAEDLKPYNQDWMNKYRGTSQLVLKPKTTEQVSKILSYCNDRRLAIVPQGGNSGLVGGSVPVFDEIILSTANMNKIRSLDPVSGILVADAGVILENADLYLRDQGYIFPLDLGAKGSCHIGGNVATNAGGLRLLRYGSLHGSVLGLEVVLPNGKVFNGLSKLRKDNTGYDMKQVFIGSEGTLGVITAVSILCPPKPDSVNVAFLGLESFEKVQDTFKRAKRELSEILSAFECMDSRSQTLVAEHSNLTRPLQDEFPFYVLIETSGSNKEHDEEKLNTFLENVMTDELVLDGVVAQDETQARNLWQWREMVPEACGKGGGVYKYDVSMTLPDMFKFRDAVHDRLVRAGVVGATNDYPVIESVGYGHIGDGNLHLNVAVRRYDDRVEALLEPFIFEYISKINGSISAEHGLGFAKKDFIGYCKDESALELMRALKRQYDPAGILNPYKYVDF